MARHWTEADVAQIEANVASLEAKHDTGDAVAVKMSAYKFKAGVAEAGIANLTPLDLAERVKTVQNRLSKF